jgi:hypothetical protein
MINTVSGVYCFSVGYQNSLRNVHGVYGYCSYYLILRISCVSGNTLPFASVFLRDSDAVHRRRCGRRASDRGGSGGPRKISLKPRAQGSRVQNWSSPLAVHQPEQIKPRMYCMIMYDDYGR